MGGKFPTEIVLISTEFFTEIGLSTKTGLSRHEEISWKICQMFIESCGQGEGKESKEMAARREIRYIGLRQRVSCLCARDRLQIRRLLLCCDVLLAVSEHEADDELEAVAIRRGKPRP